MKRLSQINEELQLKDLPLQGGQYTWKGGLNNRRMARSDKFLVLNNWTLILEIQSLLTKLTLDHFLVLLEGGGVPTKGPMPFRFESMWLKAKIFSSIIRNWWQSTEVFG